VGLGLGACEADPVGLGGGVEEGGGGEGGGDGVSHLEVLLLLLLLLFGVVGGWAGGGESRGDELWAAVASERLCVYVCCWMRVECVRALARKGLSPRASSDGRSSGLVCAVGWL
jgi:hypothetical protein